MLVERSFGYKISPGFSRSTLLDSSVGIGSDLTTNGTVVVVVLVVVVVVGIDVDDVVDTVQKFKATLSLTQIERKLIVLHKKKTSQNENPNQNQNTKTSKRHTFVFAKTFMLNFQIFIHVRTNIAEYVHRRLNDTRRSIRTPNQ